MSSALAAAAAAASDAEFRPSRIPNPGRAAGLASGPGLPGAPPPPAAAGGPGPRQPVVIDREKVCPLLLRVFPNHGGHHSLEEYAVRGQEPKGELQIYTWKDATLRELTDLIKEVNPYARRREARISFAFVYPNRQGRNVMKQVGLTFSNARRTMDDNKTLQELGFQTGDFLDAAIYA